MNPAGSGIRSTNGVPPTLAADIQPAAQMGFALAASVRVGVLPAAGSPPPSQLPKPTPGIYLTQICRNATSTAIPNRYFGARSWLCYWNGGLAPYGVINHSQERAPMNPVPGTPAATESTPTPTSELPPVVMSTSPSK